MVQRNAPTKIIGVQGVRQNQELKTIAGAADLKTKKMKKSASMKRSEVESLRSTRRVSEKQPGRPPPVVVTPQKQSPVRTPNYMKSTTSSDARKEQSRVSFKSPTSDGSNLRTKFKALASESKATKTVSSLKTMRTLTKNSSFKLARASVRKCSSVVLCENFESQRATCSSTLKDCKFPAYLSLNPGGTESEGTSAIKVCPYTYCSLNGHHHPPLPPLKCFLSARRRVVKAQRGIKLGCLSPRPRPGDAVKSDDDCEKISEERHKDFFVEIFCVDDGNPETESDYKMVLDSPIDESIDGTVDSCSAEIISPQLDIETNLDDETESDYKMVLDSPIYESINGTVDSCLAEIISPQLDIEANLDDEPMASQESLELDAFSDGDDGESTDYSQGLNGGAPQLAEPDQEPPSDMEIPIDDDPKSLQKEDAGDQTPSPDETIASAGESFFDLASVSITEVKSQDEVEDDSAMARFASKTKKPVQENSDLGLFNPRPPNFLPVEPDPEEEKVDLRHQEVDEKRNTEEWMVDYALRQVVAKLGPARKRKVALLVEAFEKVSPITKCELHLSHSPVFGLPSPIQACR